MNTADDASMIFHISDSCVLLHQCYIPKIPEDAGFRVRLFLFRARREASASCLRPLPTIPVGNDAHGHPL
jgi:hypothetical protein